MQNNELLELMKEMVKYQKILAKPVIKKLLDENLDKPEKRLAYELTDGIKTRDKIIAETGLSAGTISGWWIDWFSKGLVEKEGSRYKRIISLKDIGISLPNINNIKINLEKSDITKEESAMQEEGKNGQQ